MHLGIRTGLRLCKAHTRWVPHGDLHALEEVLKKGADWVDTRGELLGRSPLRCDGGARYNTVSRNLPVFCLCVHCGALRVLAFGISCLLPGFPQEDVRDDM